jgi:hypothetical protein
VTTRGLLLIREPENDAGRLPVTMVLVMTMKCLPNDFGSVVVGCHTSYIDFFCHFGQVYNEKLNATFGLIT